jgi:ANTAR domain
LAEGSRHVLARHRRVGRLQALGRVLAAGQVRHPAVAVASTTPLRTSSWSRRSSWRLCPTAPAGDSGKASGNGDPWCRRHERRRQRACLAGIYSTRVRSHLRRLGTTDVGQKRHLRRASDRDRDLLLVLPAGACVPATLKKDRCVDGRCASSENGHRYPASFVSLFDTVRRSVRAARGRVAVGEVGSAGARDRRVRAPAGARHCRRLDRPRPAEDGQRGQREQPQRQPERDARAGEALREEVAQLQMALESRVVIEQAKGVLYERYRISPEAPSSSSAPLLAAAERNYGRSRSACSTSL